MLHTPSARHCRAYPFMYAVLLACIKAIMLCGDLCVKRSGLYGTINDTDVVSVEKRIINNDPNNEMHSKRAIITLNDWVV